MKKALLAVAALSCMGSAALAGPNAGGTLIAALSVGTIYTTDNTGYCGSSTTTLCEGAVSQAGAGTSVINVIAAFPGNGRLSGITFGLNYGANVFLVEWGLCGNFELPDGDWPASGSGNAVTWSTAQVAQLIEVYWIAAYEYYGDCGQLHLGIHPSQGGEFADDDVPSNIDPIAAFGTFGFNCPGDAPCPAGEEPGACCFPDGSCEDLLQAACEAAGGTFNAGTSCLTFTCPQPPTGACCFGEECVTLTEQQCTDAGGDWQDGAPCVAGETCIVVPTIESSWGTIKNNYR